MGVLEMSNLVNLAIWFWVCRARVGLPLPVNFRILLQWVSLRNNSEKQCSLQEAYALRKPGGTVMCGQGALVCFNPVSVRLILYKAIKVVGPVLARELAAYRWPMLTMVFQSTGKSV
ncbi:MAG TPA: hypothetical protein DCF62_06720 [Porticoccaceae bacterium]|nr:hypothetical protein [Porticoccaceae bacterium]HCO60246.1 hypothetical protein [Porticoccaceae bacterium]